MDKDLEAFIKKRCDDLKPEHKSRHEELLQDDLVKILYFIKGMRDAMIHNNGDDL